MSAVVVLCLLAGPMAAGPMVAGPMANAGATQAAFNEIVSAPNGIDVVEEPKLQPRSMESAAPTRDPLVVAGVQMLAALAAGVIVAPLVWGGPFATVQTLVPGDDVQTGALVLLMLSVAAVPLSSLVVATAASIVGGIYARGAGPDFRTLVAALAGASTGALCAGGLAAALFLSSTLAAAAVGFWLIGLPMTAIVSAAAATVVAVYLEGRSRNSPKRESKLQLVSAQNHRGAMKF